MNIEFSVEIKEKLESEDAIERMKRALYLSMVKMKELAIRNAPVDLGFLKNSITLYPNSKNSDTYYLEDGVSYGIHLEYGTSPHWVPIKPLIEWAKRHGGDESFGYAIRGKIAKHGTNAHPFFRPAYYAVKDMWMPKYIEKCLEVENV